MIIFWDALGSTKEAEHFGLFLSNFLYQIRLPYTTSKGTYMALISGMVAWYASRGYRDSDLLTV